MPENEMINIVLALIRIDINTNSNIIFPVNWRDQIKTSSTSITW